MPRLRHKRFTIRIDYMPGKTTGKYEVYLIDHVKGRSGTTASYNTKKQAMEFIQKSLKPEIKRRRYEDFLQLKNRGKK